MQMKRWLSALLIAVALALTAKGGTALAQVAPGGGGGGGGTVTCTSTTTYQHRQTFCSQMPSNAVDIVATSTPSGNSVCSYKVPVTTTHCTTSCPSGTHLSGNSCVSNTTNPPSRSSCTGSTTHFLGCDGQYHSGYYDQTNSCGQITVAKYTSYAGGCAATTCTPSGGNTTHFLGCDGTCKSGYFDQTNSCGSVTVAKYTSTANGCTTTADGCSSTTPPSGSQCPSGDTLVNGVCTPPTASCTPPQNGPVSVSGPYITGCASQGEYSTITDYSQVLWACPGPLATTHQWSRTGTMATTDCQPVLRIDGTKPLACAAAPDAGSAWSSYTYQHCLSYLGNAVDCGPTLTYTPTKPYQVQGGQFPEPVYNPVACPVPIAVGP